MSAKDKGTGKEQSIRIEASSGLSDEEIEKMKKDAEVHAEEDKKKRELIDTKNTADTMVYTTEKMMKDVAEKKIDVTDEEKKKIDDAIAKVKDAKEKDDVEAIKSASEELSTAAQAVGMKMYQQEQAAACGQQYESYKRLTEEKKEEGAVEGEVVEDEKQA